MPLPAIPRVLGQQSRARAGAGLADSEAPFLVPQTLDDLWQNRRASSFVWVWAVERIGMTGSDEPSRESVRAPLTLFRKVGRSLVVIDERAFPV
jgi:hypothetical protein